MYHWPITIILVPSSSCSNVMKFVQKCPKRRSRNFFREKHASLEPISSPIFNFPHRSRRLHLRHHQHHPATAKQEIFIGFSTHPKAKYELYTCKSFAFSLVIKRDRHSEPMTSPNPWTEDGPIPSRSLTLSPLKKLPKPNRKPDRLPTPSFFRG